MIPDPEPMVAMRVELEVNGRPVSLEVPVRRLLSDLLRDDLGLTGTHVGCEQGACGACTVILDGRPVRSCITLAVTADGASVTTVEGLAPPEAPSVPSPMQAALRDRHAVQCGFCTPGLLCTLAAADPAEHPDDDAIRELLEGTLCRCTGYAHIVDAVRHAWGRDP